MLGSVISGAEKQWKNWLLTTCLGVFLSAVWYRNFEISQIDASQTLTFMNMFRDPSLYSDSFLYKQAYPFHLYSLYYWIAGFIGMFFDPYWGVYGYFVVINVLCLLSVFYLAHTVTQNTAAAFVAMLALTLQWQLSHGLGGLSALGIGPYPDQMAVGLLLIAIALFLKRRFGLAFALAGLIFNIHASFSFFILTMFAVALVIRREFVFVIKGGLIAALAASPLLAYMLLHPLSPEGSLSPHDWYRLVSMRISGHTMPFSWEFGRYAKFLPYPLILLLSHWMPSKPNESTETRERQRSIAALSFGVLLLCLLGTIFTEWIPVRTIITLTLFRSTKFIIVFAVILYAGKALPYLESNKGSDWIPHCLLLAGLIAASHPVIYLSLSFMILFYLRKAHLPLTVAAVVLLCLASAFSIHHFGWEMIFARSNLGLFAAILALFVFYHFLVVGHRFSLGFLSKALAICIVASAPLSPLYHGYTDLHYFDSVKELQVWLKDHTPKSESVLLPPYAGIWSGLSERGDIITFTELGFPIYAPFLGQEILRRAQDFNLNPLEYKKGAAFLNDMTREYERWDETKFLGISKKYGCSYAVVGKDKSLQFPIVYENSFFRVFKLSI